MFNPISLGVEGIGFGLYLFGAIVSVTFRKDVTPRLPLRRPESRVAPRSELIQKAQITGVKAANVIDAMTHHAEPLHPQTGSKTTPTVRIKA